MLTGPTQAPGEPMKDTTQKIPAATFKRPQDPATVVSRLSLKGLAQGEGRAAAPIVWLALACFLPHGRTSTRVWPSNHTLASRTGLTVREVERALALLRRSGKISIRYGKRRKCRAGRIITMHLIGRGPNPLVRLPPFWMMMSWWKQVRGVRERPGSLVALATAAYVLASSETGLEFGALSSTASLTALRDLVGAGHGSTFTARLAALEAAGVLRRSGEQWRDGIAMYITTAVESFRVVAPEPAPRLRPAPMRRITNEASLAHAMAEWPIFDVA